MKQQANFSEKVLQLMTDKSWDQLSGAERSVVLEETDQATYENYRCLIGVSKALHQQTPSPSPVLKDRLMAQMRQRHAAPQKKAFWEKWFQWEVPVWQVSLASLAFVLLYLSGIPGNTPGLDSSGSDQPFFQGPVDTVFLDVEEAPEDSSDQRQQLLESNLFQYLPSWLNTNKPSRVQTAAERTFVAAALPDSETHLLPPTQAVLSAQQIIPLELLEIRG
ncbi:MAG: hypothetical protein HRU41_35090 [Saprospiraceae bacterium]|nr:hypothetical protein [Saprospiraceae bacterium]